jgi:hypothetical protein
VYTAPATRLSMESGRSLWPHADVSAMVVRCCAVSLQDIAIVTGAEFIAKDLGMKVDQTVVEQLGVARKVGGVAGSALQYGISFMGRGYIARCERAALCVVCVCAGKGVHAGGEALNSPLSVPGC